MVPITSIIIGMILLVAGGFLILAMIVIRSIRSIHGRQNQTAPSQTLRVPPIVHWAIRVLLRAGVRVSLLGPVMLLTVRGRKTGQPRTVAVDLYEHDGRHFLIATHGEGSWVSNLRAAGEGSLSLGRSHQTFTAVELPSQAGGPVIKNVLGPILASRGVRGSTLRDHLGVRADSPLEDFINVARTHPVFELRAVGSHTHHHPHEHCFEVNPPPMLAALHEESGLEEAEQLAVQPVGRFGRNPVAHAFEALVTKRTGHMLS